MGEARVRIERRGRIAVLYLDKPPVNALYTDLFEAITGALDDLEKDEGVAAVVVTGGERIFSAGLDLKAVAAARPEELLTMMEAGYAFFQRVEGYPKPTVAAVRGACLGGGLGLAIACDMRVAGEGALFGLPEARIGFPFLWGVTHLYLRTLPRGPALDLMLTGRNIDAEEARSIQLVKAVVPDDEALQAACTLAETVASALPPFAAGSVKAVLYEAAREPSSRKVFDLENRHIVEVLSKVDLSSWLSDYLQKS